MTSCFGYSSRIAVCAGTRSHIANQAISAIANTPLKINTQPPTFCAKPVARRGPWVYVTKPTHQVAVLQNTNGLRKWVYCIGLRAEISVRDNKIDGLVSGR